MSTSTDMMQERARLQREISALQETIRKAKRDKERATQELGVVDAALRARVQGEGVSSRMRPGSKRFRTIVNRVELRAAYRLPSHPVRAFDDHYKATPGGGAQVDPALISSAFLSCGGGSTILQCLVRLWDTDPALDYVPDEDVRTQIRVGSAIQQAKTILRMGLCTPDAFAEVFGGCMDLTTKKLRDLREMAQSIREPISDVVGGGCYGRVRAKRSIEALRKVCRPLMLMSAEHYLIWREFAKARTMHAYEMNRARFLHGLACIETIPGRDPIVERAINEYLISREALHPSIIRALNMMFLPFEHPARYRPGVMRVLVRRYDEYMNNEDHRPIELRLDSMCQREWDEGEARETYAIQQCFR